MSDGERSRVTGTMVLVVGAGRSGTNFLAHLVEQAFDAQNLFENRYIWSYRATTGTHDHRSAVEATPTVSRRISEWIRRQVQGSPALIVDKTPSNALRIPFALAVFPQALVVNVIRDPRGCIASRKTFVDDSLAEARQRRSRVRLLRHLVTLLRRRNLPLSRVPAMLGDQAGQFLQRRLGNAPASFGERTRSLSAADDVIVTAARQWREVVATAVRDGRALGTDRYLELHYEDLIRTPERVVESLARFFDQPVNPRSPEKLREANTDKLEQWRQLLGEADLAAIEPIVRPLAERLGYRW